MSGFIPPLLPFHLLLVLHDGILIHMSGFKIIFCGFREILIGFIKCTIEETRTLSLHVRIDLFYA